MSKIDPAEKVAHMKKTYKAIMGRDMTDDDILINARLIRADKCKKFIVQNLTTLPQIDDVIAHLEKETKSERKPRKKVSSTRKSDK